MISALLVYNQKGEVLISRLYRDGLRRTIADVFRIQVISNPDVQSPVLTLGSTSFLHIKHANIYLVAVTRSNVDAGLVFEFLYKIVSLGQSYFSGHSLLSSNGENFSNGSTGKHGFNEDNIKNNFALVYELFDEIIDFGFPQNTETDTLQMYIAKDVPTNPVKSLTRTLSISTSVITSQATGAISWRQPGIKHRKNEIFLDVFEDVNLLVSASGAVLRADVNGHIQMKAVLSGMPECKFGLNDTLSLNSGNMKDNVSRGSHDATRSGSITLEDCQFHQCVRLGEFESTKTISFVPPEGEFELMRYRAVENISLPFKVIPQIIQHGKTKLEYSIVLKANFDSKLGATNVEIKIPTPKTLTKYNINYASGGKAKYEPGSNHIIWKFNRVAGGSEYQLRAEVDMSPEIWTKPPIQLQFSLTMFTSSGIVVRYLKVFEKTNYNTVKWVRYVVRAGSYEIRY
ncbi:AP-2 complex subunit MU [Nadsonia fulvescens var. elongata DSM 6958]|uniref:AP-2 complex subunit MU n=1 Tax=Nadsonia fulvescens var. elongata DSM 6958 TaxID=857566 RepID=A0A1E3PL48_9ASCO|nr:AP-2 complex subunit MU [Nadsonia fulvescens var. elongata DSM 6958]